MEWQSLSLNNVHEPPNHSLHTVAHYWSNPCHHTHRPALLRQTWSAVLFTTDHSRAWGDLTWPNGASPVSLLMHCLDRELPKNSIPMMEKAMRKKKKNFMESRTMGGWGRAGFASSPAGGCRHCQHAVSGKLTYGCGLRHLPNVAYCLTMNVNRDLAN